MNQKGFSHVVLIVLLVVIGAVGFVGWRMQSNRTKEPAQQASDLPRPEQQETKSDAPEFIKWQFNDKEWGSDKKPPSCPEPISIKSPSDVKLATAVLYPGQTRGQYKPHGGIRFDGKNPEDISVRAPMDAYLVNGSRYIEAGEIQYLLTFIHPCGMSYRFDHLLTLTPEIQKIVDTLPEPQQDDTRTTNFASPVFIKRGDLVATAAGHKKPTPNTGYDLGVYDLRKPNEASKDPDFAAARANEKSMTYYAVCWLDLLIGEEKTVLKALPGGDGRMGKASDYCK